MEKQRKVIVHIGISEDGYMARPDGDLGDGISLICDASPSRALELKSIERFEHGMVQLHYRVL
jgi:hypothetical protein